MRNKVVYSCNVKIYALGWFHELLEVLPPADCGNIFPEKSCQDDWRSGNWLTRGEVIIADQAKLCSSIHSTFEGLIVQCVVRHCYGKELGPFCWPVLAEGMAVFSISYQSAEHAS